MSLPKVSYSPSVHSTASLVTSSKPHINDEDRKPWHLVNILCLRNSLFMNV